MNDEEFFAALAKDIGQARLMRAAGFTDPDSVNSVRGMILLKAAARCFSDVFKEADFVAVAKQAWSSK